MMIKRVAAAILTGGGLLSSGCAPTVIAGPQTIVVGAEKAKYENSGACHFGRIGQPALLNQGPIAVRDMVWTGSEFGIFQVHASNGEGKDKVNLLRSGIDGQIKSETGLDFIKIDNYYSNISAAWTGKYFGLSWQSKENGKYGLNFATIDASGKRVGEVLRVFNRDDIIEPRRFPSIPGVKDAGEPSLSPNHPELKPKLIWQGSEFALIWSDNNLRSTDCSVYLARFGGNGNRSMQNTKINGAESHCAASPYISSIWGASYGISWFDIGRSDLPPSQVKLVSKIPDKTGEIDHLPADSTYVRNIWNGRELINFWTGSYGPKKNAVYSSLANPAQETPRVSMLAEFEGQTTNFEAAYAGNWIGLALSSFNVSSIDRVKDDTNGPSSTVVFNMITRSKGEFMLFSYDQQSIKMQSTYKISNSEDPSSPCSIGTMKLAWTGTEFAVVYSCLNGLSVKNYLTRYGCAR